jgi:hypothetical protein
MRILLLLSFSLLLIGCTKTVIEPKCNITKVKLLPERKKAKFRVYRAKYVLAQEAKRYIRYMDKRETYYKRAIELLNLQIEDKR